MHKPLKCDTDGEKSGYGSLARYLTTELPERRIAPRSAVRKKVLPTWLTTRRLPRYSLSPWRNAISPTALGGGPRT